MTKFLNISTDTTLGGVSPSDEIVSSQKALKAYIDTQSGGALPSQTGNAGKFLTTDGTDASWGTSTDQDITFSKSEVVFRQVNSTGLVVKQGNFDVFKIYDSGIEPALNNNYWLGSSSKKWSRLYITKLNNGADITVPTTGGTMLVADSTGATEGQVLTLDSNLAPVWANPTAATAWGNITGDITAQTDLQTALNNIDCGTMS